MSPREHIIALLEDTQEDLRVAHEVVDYHACRAVRADWSALLEATLGRLRWLRHELAAMAADMEA